MIGFGKQLVRSHVLRHSSLLVSRMTAKQFVVKNMNVRAYRGICDGFYGSQFESRLMGGALSRGFGTQVKSSRKAQVDEWLEARQMDSFKVKFSESVIDDIVSVANRDESKESRYADIKASLKAQCGFSESEALLMVRWLLHNFNFDNYSTYDKESMGSFFQLWVCDRASDAEGKAVAPSGTRDEFVAAISKDKESPVLIAEIKSRKKYVGELYSSAFVFGDNVVPAQVLSKLHVGAPGVGKTAVTKQALKHLPIAFPGMATAFVELRKLKRSFARPPTPQEIFNMAIKESGGKVKKLFVFYDDFEVCYDRAYGEELTSSVYEAADENVDIMCHVLGSSQWLGELVHRRLPVMSMLPSIYATDTTKRFEYYGKCTTINEGRMGDFGVHCEVVMEKDEFGLLFDHICKQRGVDIELKDDFEVLKAVQWLACGNARMLHNVVLRMKGHTRDAFVTGLMLELDRAYYGLTPQGKEILDKVLSKLIAENSLGAYLSPYGQDERGLGAYMAKTDPFKLKSVPRSALHFTDAGDYQTDIIKRLIEAGLLTQDSDGNVYPGRLVYLPMHAISETKATRDDTKQQLKKGVTWLAEKILAKFSKGNT